ncbi:MAG: DNA polymerase III subunit alpha, partial [Methylococcaceae bacterium]|nr:DNA polymerase III subunit alpha [Methylococcaceae bacterium]
ALIVGGEFRLDDGLKFLLLAPNRQAYGQLSRLITRARRQAEKGSYRLTRQDLADSPTDDCLCIWLPSCGLQFDDGCWLAAVFPHRLWLGIGLFLEGGDPDRLIDLQRLAADLAIPALACNDVHMHRRSRKPLQDTLTAIRHGVPLARLGYRLFPNAERHLRPLPALAELYPPELLAESLRIAERCHFSLDQLRYEYPRELVPEGHSPASWLRELTERGLRRRWPEGSPDKVRRQVEHELELIAEMGYEPFFLTVHDVVDFARGRGILCQGRGSAANSAVCFALGITEVDPARLDLLFERFVSKERGEPPDIDVDFEHERREEVIQYIYEKYGRHRAALAASVTTYRSRSAVRDVGKALGLDRHRIARLVREIDRLGGYRLSDDRLKAAGVDPESPVIRRLLELVEQLRGFPRHLSQHVGGFVIAAQELSELVPVENAAMADRTVIQWDKDDLEGLGLLKVDVLALGMLTAIRKALGYLQDYGIARGTVGAALPISSASDSPIVVGGAHPTPEPPLTLADIPPEDPEVYAMLQQADSIGVFQVESRAQMSMLPRLRPANYYDLVIQIAIVRPGPIQGDMVHPYLARRQGLEPVSYPSPEVKRVLERTLGVPIFQEQVMQLSMVAAGFSAGEADQLRRAMAAWHRQGGLEPFEAKLLKGMQERGYDEAFARQIYRQIRGFGEYGFPESHSASFALLAYASAWLKRHHPAVFTCALLNCQPMGFYGPSQLVQDLRRHGGEVRSIDVRYSDYDCSLEARSSTPVPPIEGLEAPALRLGLRLVKGLSRQAAEALTAARAERPFSDLQDLAARSGINRRDLEALAAADALAGLAGHRHRAFWEVSGLETGDPWLPAPPADGALAMLPVPGEGDNVVADYASSGLSLRRHPLALLRERLARRGIKSAEEILGVRDGAIARTAGLVVCRQRPGTASGVTFVTLEDETGQTNLIVWAKVAEVQRKALLHSTLLAVSGVVQHEAGVTHLVAGRLIDLSSWLQGLVARSRDFH